MDIGVNTNISSADLTGQTTGTKTLSKPAGTANTDILIAIWASYDGAGHTISLSPPAGWTALTASGATTANTHGWAFWSLGSNASLGFSMTNTDAPGDIGYVCVGFTGVDNIAPIDVQAATANTNSGTNSITASAVTIASPGAWHLIANWDANDGAYSATGFTAKDNGSTLHERVGLLYNQTPKSAGSTGTVSCSNSGSTSGQELAVISFALRPDGQPAAARMGGVDFAHKIGGAHNHGPRSVWQQITDLALNRRVRLGY